MNQEILLKHQFVDFIPEELHESTLYISMRFATVSHLCACGCGTKVVTPLKPTDWKLTFDGKTITLHPSIGNWSFPCRSHYWIRDNKVRWAEAWSRSQIDAGRAHARRTKDKHFEDMKNPGDLAAANRNPERKTQKVRWWMKLWPW